MTLTPRLCGLCRRETTDWTVAVAIAEDGTETVDSWCRDAEDCLRAHEAVETAALESA